MFLLCTFNMIEKQAYPRRSLQDNEWTTRKAYQQEM